MSGRLSGKRALVTAAGQGIGRAIAQLFAREGAEVWATDVDPAKLTGLDGCCTARLDVLDKAAIEGLVATRGPFDVLVNCAGFVHHGTIFECSDEDFAFTMDLNVRSMFWTQSRAAGYARQGLGLDRQHRERLLEREGATQPFRLRNQQGGGDRAYQGGRGGFRHARHPLQRHLPRDH